MTEGGVLRAATLVCMYIMLHEWRLRSCIPSSDAIASHNAAVIGPSILLGRTRSRLQPRRCVVHRRSGKANGQQSDGAREEVAIGAETAVLEPQRGESASDCVEAVAWHCRAS